MCLLCPDVQERLIQEQQRSEQLQSQLASLQNAQQQAAAAAASQLGAAQEALGQLEQEASEKLSQADLAAAEAEGQLDELAHDLDEARDAVKVCGICCCTAVKTAVLHCSRIYGRMVVVSLLCLQTVKVHAPYSGGLLLTQYQYCIS